ncbi:hypothetical protein Vretimale_2015 [Volvox reticuliferus]|uniref:Uncharacterized protein n=1 Tax=Volvox reticuliferus TaxID=1737510 RepID=A0A8J4DB47_9CHLO|nr:hypothetical protein Vretifemale_4329 [Volvox reticuliferus]GIL96130.1 hypothetical protein Vretimale_2015 [Volvox reticuliferus]
MEEGTNSDRWVALLSSILEPAAQPFTKGGEVNVSLDGKGIGGAWAMMAEISQRPGFPDLLRRLVAAIYPRAGNVKSSLDQLLQRLVLERPHLADCVVVPFLEALVRHPVRIGAPLRAAATTATVTGGAAAAAVPGSLAPSPQCPVPEAGVEVGEEVSEGEKAEEEEEGDDGSNDDELGDEQDAKRRGRPQNASSAHVGGQRKEGIAVAPPPPPAAGGRGKAKGRGLRCRAPAPELTSGARAGSGAAVNAATVASARFDFGYSQRLLPVSWLLQCLGEVSEPLRCLWPQHRQEEVRAHVLAAAARFFAHHHRDSADEERVRYIHHSPIVSFVRDCFASTPPYARLELLEDAMRLTAPPLRACPKAVATSGALGTFTPPEDSSEPQGARGTPAHCGLKDMKSGEEAGNDTQAQRVEHPGEEPPSKRRRLLNTPQVPAVQALCMPQSSTSTSQPTVQHEHGERGKAVAAAVAVPVTAEKGVGDDRVTVLPPLPDTVAAGGEHGRAAWFDLDQRGRSLVPWAALLAHMSEEEEEAKRSPNQQYVMSPLALCELLLARGDLFGPADVEAAGYCLLRCLTSLEPAQSAELVTRVLACPSSAPASLPNVTPEPELPTPYGAEAAGSIAAGDTYAMRGCNRAGEIGGGLAAALAVLRRPLRPGAALLPMKAVLRTKRGGRRGSGKAVNAKAAGAAGGADEVVELVAGPPPGPLTALWLLSHVMPVLMGSLEHGDEEEAEGEETARAGGNAVIGNRDGPEVPDVGIRARALTSLAALLRQPELLLPETQPEELPTAVQVLAMQLRGLGAGSRGLEGRSANAEARGRGESVTGAGGGTDVGRCDAALQRLAALLCRTFGLDESDGGGSGGPGRLESLVQHARAKYSGSPEAGPPFPVPGEEPAHEGNGLAWRRPIHRYPHKLASCSSPIWPAMRPLLALLDHLPYNGHVATAIHKLLFAALLQRCPSPGSGTGRNSAPVPDATETAATTVAAQPVVKGGEAGAVAAEEVLGLLLVEAILGGGKEAQIAAPALRLSAIAKLNVLRLVVLAAEAASHRGEDTTPRCAPVAAAMEVACREVAVAAAESGLGRQTERHEEEAPPGSGDDGGQSDPWVMPPIIGATAAGMVKYDEVQLVQVVLERLGSSIVAVAEVLLPAQQRTQQRPGAAAPPALPAASSAALAGALTRVAPQAFLVRLAAGVVAAAAREEAEGAKGTIPGRGATHGPAMGSRTSATTTTTSPDAPAAWVVCGAAEALVRLLRGSAPGVAALRPFVVEAPPGPAGLVAVGSGGMAALVSSSSSGGGGGGGTRMGTLPGQIGLEPRMTGLQLVQHTQQALRLLAAAVYNAR